MSLDGASVPGLVSTIIPVYNRGAMLREAVGSVLAQNWQPIEIIIVDDGSTDDTPQVMAELRACNPGTIRLHRQSNAGPGRARQAGLELSCGEFVQFLDSDDVLLPDKFERQVAGLRGDPDAGIAYGPTYARQDGVRLAEPAQRTGERRRHLFPALLQGPLWPTLTPLYRRLVLNAIGPWPDGWQLEDWIYDARAAVQGVQLHFIDDYVAETRNHAEARLCNLWIHDHDALRERAQAYATVFACAQQAGVDRDSAEMQQFVRSLFWMARTAGARGLTDEARQLFDLARAHAITPGWDYRVFAAAAAVMGWRRAAGLAETVERWRR